MRINHFLIAGLLISLAHSSAFAQLKTVDEVSPHIADMARGINIKIEGAKESPHIEQYFDVKDNNASLVLLTRQNYEERKTRELTGMLERLLGAGKVGVYLTYDWPADSKAFNPLEAESLKAVVVMDKRLTNEDVAFVKNLTVRILGIEPARGDKLEMYQRSSASMFREVALSPQNAIDLLKFMILVLVILVCATTVLRAGRQISESLERVATTRKVHDADISMMPRQAQNIPSAGRSPGLAAGTQSGAALALPAVVETHPETVAKILEDESSRSVALFIGTMEPELAGKVLANLSPSKQEEVALTLSQMELEPDPKELAQLQAQIHLKMRKILLEKK
ncbi:hypothetical protein ACFL6Y_03600 [Elusimicrobiota bacterium]